jgi:diadenylate cyclase
MGLIAAVVVILIFRALTPYLPASGAVFSVLGTSAIILTTMLFSREIRRDVFSLNLVKHGTVQFSNRHGASDEDLNVCVSEVVRALLSLAKNNTGALLVFCADSLPAHIVESGTRLDAVVSSPLLSAIFNTKAPLHDGAVIIRGNRIIAAGCFLPLSQDINIPKELGTRHRAAIGISESAEVLTIMVSEETGVISVAKNGELLRYFDAGMLTRTLEAFFGLTASGKSGKSARKRRK